MSAPERTEEWRAIGRAAGFGLNAVAAAVRDTHSAVSRRVAESLPPEATAAVEAEQSISAQVYDAVGELNRLLPGAAGQLAAAVAPDGPAPSQTRVGGFAQAAANALWGDRLEHQEPVLAVRMSLRHERQDLPATTAALAEAYPEATADIVVFVHGLAEDDRAWQLPFDGDPTSYGQRLAADAGRTSVSVRYNTGRHISQNGEDLDALLSQMVASWPVKVASVAVVGHSMGGLVARSAAHQGAERGAQWTELLRTVVTLGTPHTGAPLERAVHVIDRALRLAPESEPISRVLASRSAGIKDLRYGSLLEQDWAGEDPDEFLRDGCASVPLLPHVTYCWVAASLGSDPKDPLGVLLGDGLVRYGSAGGQGHHRREGFPMANGAQVNSTNHLRLLNHPAVYAHLREWLTMAPAA